jgi:cyclopropane fatty-acyl-phospholipid synthase-like methyltransferase
MSDQDTVSHYDATYSNFASELYSKIRDQAFGQNIGQTGWLTAEEQDMFIEWLALGRGSNLLDIACGSGGPTLRIASKTGCNIHGIDIHEQGIEAASKQAEEQNLSERVNFEVVDGSGSLRFSDAEFDGIICVDAVNHLPQRSKVFAEWSRILKPGGRLVFTDPITITGPLTNEEIGIRSSIGFFIFVPRGIDEQLLEQAGFDIVQVEDRTQNMATMASNWLKARENYASELKEIEGADTYSGQQTFFKVTAEIAQEGRLSRFAFHAVKKTS